MGNWTHGKETIYYGTVFAPGGTIRFKEEAELWGTLYGGGKVTVGEDAEINYLLSNAFPGIPGPAQRSGPVPGPASGSGPGSVPEPGSLVLLGLSVLSLGLLRRRRTV
jgi:hypothetical protein